MTCENCGDKGLTVLNWTDAPPDYAVCLCAIGQDLRATSNEGRATVPLWQVWCAVHQVSPERVVLLETVHTSEELSALGFGTPAATVNREAALLTAAKRGKR